MMHRCAPQHSPPVVALIVVTAGRSIWSVIPNCLLLTAAAFIVMFADGK